MKDKVMSEKTAKVLVVVSAVFLLLTGFGLYKLFEYQGINKDTTSKKLVNYDVKDYVETVPVIYNDYNDVYSKINVSKVKLKNLDDECISDFLNKEEELIGYITSYRNEILNSDNYTNNNVVNSTIKMQINNAILSVYYELDFMLDDDTEKVLSNDDLLQKYNYTKKYIAEKIYDEDLIISSGQMVIDRNTNISLTKEDIERKKSDYIDRIILDFDNIINMYIENKSLTLVYNKSDLRGLFFNNEFDSEIITRYLK